MRNGARPGCADHPTLRVGGRYRGCVTPGTATDSAVFVALEVIGTAGFAVSGVMAAARSSMDWLGALALAVVVAIGGGTLRDLLLGQLPVAWLLHAWPLTVAVLTAVATLVILRLRPDADPTTWTPVSVADAIGLSTFAILGTEIGLVAGLNPVLAVALGVITGVGGGVIRDVLTGTRPMVLVGQIYALAGIVGGFLFVVLLQVGANTQLAVWLSVLVIIAIRLVSIRRGWNLPKVVADPEGAGP